MSLKGNVNLNARGSGKIKTVTTSCGKRSHFHANCSDKNQDNKRQQDNKNLKDRLERIVSACAPIPY